MFYCNSFKRGIVFLWLKNKIFHKTENKTMNWESYKNSTVASVGVIDAVSWIVVNLVLLLYRHKNWVLFCE